MPKKIVWMSKHLPTPTQRAELDRLFPDHTLILETKPWSDATDITRRFHEANGDAMVVVAPWHVMKELIKRGVKPLIYAEMLRVPCDSPEREVILGAYSGRQRCFKFLRFHYVDDIAIISRPITEPQLD